MNLYLGFEVVIQASLQILILLLNQTETPTTGGLETVFEQEYLGMNQITILCLSIALSLWSCIKLHTKLVIFEKGFCPIMSKILIFLWGTFATLRRILSIVAMFTPSMGLFSLLHHWRAEQRPFRIRMEYARRYTIEPQDEIHLFGVNDSILWTKLDRWDYSDPLKPTPPPYSHYTLLSLKHTFIAVVVLSALQLTTLVVVKFWTSRDFREETHTTNMVIHVLENLNFASPFKDWNQWTGFSLFGNHGRNTINELRIRYKNVVREMVATFAVNLLFTLILMVPLWHCGNVEARRINIYATYIFLFLVFQIMDRHTILKTMMKPKKIEEQSYNNAILCGIVTTACILGFSILEIASYFIYLFKVSNLEQLFCSLTF